MKKVLSLVLTLAMLVSVLAGLSIVNVSAHQNQSSSIDFENINIYDTTLKKWVALEDVQTIPTKEESISDGAVVYQSRRYNGGGFDFDGTRASAFAGANYEDAPANVEKYGKVLRYYCMKDWTYDGVDYAPTSGYFQYSISPGKTFTGSVSIKASFYNNTLHYRTLRVHGAGSSSNQTIRFNESGSSIAVFGGFASINKKWSANKWYDVELKFNIDSKYYEFVVYEDGELFGELSGVYTGSTYQNINKFDLFYNNTMNQIANSRDQITWIDNLSISSINNLEPPSSDERIIYDFEDFEGQSSTSSQSAGMPTSSQGSWAAGYSGYTGLINAKAVQDENSDQCEVDIDQGTSVQLYSPAYDASTGIHQYAYQYAQLKYTLSSKNVPDRYRITWDVKMTNGNSQQLNLFSSNLVMVNFSHSSISCAGKTVDFTPNNYDWFNMDLIVDAETGWYQFTVKNLTSPSQAPVTVTGYYPNMISVWDSFASASGNPTSYFQMNTTANKTSDNYILFDNVYIGEYFENEIPASVAHDFNGTTANPEWYQTAYEGDVTVDDVTVSADSTAAAKYTITPPHPDASYTFVATVSVPDFNSFKQIDIDGMRSFEIFGDDNASARKYRVMTAVRSALEANTDYVLKIDVPNDKLNVKSTATLYYADGTTKVANGYTGQFKNNSGIVITVSKSTVEGAASTLKLSNMKFTNVKINAGSSNTASTGKFAVNSTATSAAVQTMALPFSYTNQGFEYGVDLAFEDFNSAKTLSFDDTAFATVDKTGLLTLGGATAQLAAGETYRLFVDADNGDAPTAKVTLAGLETTVAPTSRIKIKSDAGVSTFTVDNAQLDIIYNFEMRSADEYFDFNVADDVEITFANPLSKTVTADAFKVYAPMGVIDDSALVADVAVAFSEDRKTVALSFDKLKSTHYHIAFEVSDIYGATLNDIVEVDTEPDIYRADDIKFFDADGAEAVTLPSGTVTAKTTIVSGDGNTYDANMWIALYNEAGALKSVKLTPVEFNATEQVVSTEVSVPGDGKAYFVKAGIVLPNLKPVAFGKIHTQAIILRLDDLKVDTMEEYVALTQWAAENEVALSIGMVCNSIDEDNEPYIEAVKDMVKTGFVEIWCHGYDHKYHEGTGVTSEFYQQTPEYQAAVLEKCYDCVYEKTDGVVKLSCLGTPSGAMDEDTFKALEMVPEYRVNFGNVSVPYSGNGFVNLTNSLWMEPSTGKLNPLDTLKGFYDNRTVGKEYMIYGCHAGYFDADNVAIFKDFVEYLKTKDIAFMTPTQYADFIS